jgi:hypothetical protein
MNGTALPVEHGFPARLVVPGLYGYVSACKWVVDIEVTTFQDAVAYWSTPGEGWAQQAPVKTESRIDVPASGSQVKAGRVAVAGVAWAQHKGIEDVEVQVDNGPWNEAMLAPVLDIDTWRQSVWEWPDVRPGQHTIQARATDETGYKQTACRSRPRPTGRPAIPCRRSRFTSDARYGAEAGPGVGRLARGRPSRCSLTLGGTLATAARGCATWHLEERIDRSRLSGHQRSSNIVQVVSEELLGCLLRLEEKRYLLLVGRVSGEGELRPVSEKVSVPIRDVVLRDKTVRHECYLQHEHAVLYSVDIVRRKQAQVSDKRKLGVMLPSRGRQDFRKLFRQFIGHAIEVFPERNPYFI